MTMGGPTLRITSLKTVYLEESELKDAIIMYLKKSGEDRLAHELSRAVCEMDWVDNGEFSIFLDKELECKVAKGKED